ncbi:MAG: LysM peptidoglycan-binding domain-containing protein [Candidatus Sphingomonas phytovorans]|nr:LysM peptidoglycan-binding domain-containing protein [Sphingomonas sp.]WEJ98121.1 MAG: LysM peptidoglycan-binding domain-containing protein [Sphingomonas sp.]
MVSIFTGLGAGFERGSRTMLGSSGLLGSGSIGRNNEQVSLNAATGNLLISQRDDFLVGVGQDSEIARTYNSLGDMSDDNGDNWRQSTDRRVYGLTGTVNTTGSTVKRVSGDGSEIAYTWQTIGGVAAYWTAEGAGAYDKLSYASGVWTWTDGDTWDTEKYAAHGVYGLTGTVNTAGSTIKRVLADGTSSTYSWDSATSKYIVSAGTASTDNLAYSGGVWTWSNSGSPLTQVYSNNGASWRVTELATIRGQKLSFSYSGANLSRVTTHNGDYEEYVWSGVNITQIVTGYTDLVTSVAKTLTRTRYGYDGSNRLATVTVDLTPNDNSIADGATYVTTYTYDGSSKRVASISQTDGSQIDILYDGSGRVSTFSQAVAAGVARTTTIAYFAGYTTITDSLGQVTRLDYNADDSLAKITAPPAFAGAAAQVTQFTYTAAGSGNVSSVIDPLGVAATFTYDGSGNVLTATDRLGNVVTRTYTARNEVLTETRTGSDASGAIVSHTSRYVYNDIVGNLSFGSLAYYINPEGRVTYYTRDTFGRLFGECFMNDAFYDISSLNSSESIAVDLMNAWFKGIPDRSGTVILRDLPDARGNTRFKREFSTALVIGNGSPDLTAPYAHTDYVYDQAGQLLSRTTTGLGIETFVYDGLGRVIASTDLNGNTTSFAFNDSAQQTIVTLTNGYVQTSVYNKADELISFTDSGSNVTGGTATYAYDQRGQLRVTTDATGHKAYSVYDKTGRKIADVDHYGNLIEYRYDADSRLVATVRYNIPVTGTLFDDLSDVTKTPEMSALRPDATTLDLWTWTVYDAGGRVIEKIDGDGGVTTYQYDGESRLIGTTRYANKLDATQVASIRATLPTAMVLPVADAARDSVARNFYDKAGLLIGVLDGEGYLSRITYDNVGRKVSETGYATITTAGLRATGSFNALVASVTAVANPADRIMRYVYDAQSHLRFQIDGLNHVTEYVYDSGVAGGAIGVVRQTIHYAGTIGVLADYRITTVKAAVAALAGNPDNRKSWAVYDASNRLAYAIDATGAVTGYSYDNLGQVTKAVRFAASRPTSTLPDLATMTAWQTANASAAADRVTRSYYTARGELRYTVDAEGYVSWIDYDAEGRAVTTRRWDSPIAATDATTIADVQALATGSFATTSTAYDNDGRVAWTSDGEGVLTTYTYNANGTLNSTYRANGTADQVQTLYEYDNAGRVIARHDAYGTADEATTRFAYDGLGNAVSVTDALGNASYNYYDRLGRVVSTRDAENYVTETTYNAFGDVASVTRRANRATNAASVPTLPAYVADPARDATSYIYYTILGQVAATRDAEDYVTEYSYTNFGEVASTTRRANKATNPADATTPPVYVADPASDATSYAYYDRLGRVTTTRDAESYVTEIAYDAFGQTVSVTRRANRATNTADPATLPVYAADASRDATSFTYYNRRGQVTTTRNAEGYVTEMAYDAAGNIVSITRRANKATGAGDVATLPGYTPDALKDATSYSYYNRRGQVVATRDAEDYVTETTYNARGEAISVTRRANRADNPASTTTLPTVTADAGRDATTSFQYDRMGRITRSTDALGYYEQYTYTALGQRATVVNKLASVAGAGNAALYTTSYAYDKRGLLLSETLPVSSVKSDGTVQATTVTNSYGYDSRGNRTSMVEAAGLAEERTTIYVHDRLDRLVETHGTTANATSSGVVGTVVSAQYDARGNVIQKTDAMGARTLFYYDKLDRITVQIGATGTYSTISYGDVTGAGSTQVTRVYAVQLASLPAAGGTPPSVPAGTYRQTTSNFDKLGHLTSTVIDNVRTGSWVSGVYVTSAATTVTVSYQYDAGGNVVTTTDGNGGVIWSWFDKLDRKTAQVDQNNYLTSWTFDAEGNVLNERRHANAASEAIAIAAPPTVSANAADRVTNFTYDRNGRRLTEQRTDVEYYMLTSQSTGTLASTISSSDIAYSYNALGQVRTKTEAVDNGGSTPTITYTYDEGGRLIVESRIADPSSPSLTPTVRYFYNGLGDLTRTQQGGASADNGADRITTSEYWGGRLTGTVDAGGNPHRYYYDLAGRKTGESYERVRSDLTTLHEGLSYQYDAAGNLIRQAYGTVSSGVFTDAGDVTTLSYNAYGEVVSRGLMGFGSGTAVVQEQYAYDDAGHLWKSSAGDGVWRYYVYDANGNRTLTLEDAARAWGDLVDRASIGDVLGIATNGNENSLGSVYIDGINATVTVYDARNQATSAIQPQRQLNSGATGTATTADLMTERTYNAFGEVLTETDARGSTTSYSYNTMGRTTAVQHAGVGYETTHGSFTTIAPTEGYAYDRSGRLIGTRDANSMANPSGIWKSRLLLAGSGFGGTDALVVKEYHSDGGVRTNVYDVFGDLRDAADELNRHTINVYNKLGQLTQVTHAGGLVDNYDYDVLGQRTRHWNSFLGASDVEKTDYDVQGRIVSSVAFGGDVTTMTYSWSATTATAGLGTFGAVTQRTTYANGKWTEDVSDGFDHMVSHTDMGGRVTAFTYDSGGRLIERSGAEVQRYTYLNTGLAASISTGTMYGSVFYETAHADYSYNENSNKLTEYATIGGAVTQNASATYDALGRMTSWAEAGNGTAPAASVTWSYDASGNIRHLSQTYRVLDSYGNASATATGPEHFWYDYDSMNRVVTDRGALSGGVVVRGAKGVSLAYDAAGQRRTVLSDDYMIGYAQTWVWYPDYDPGSGHHEPMPMDPGVTGDYEYRQVNFFGQRQETYSYDNAGNLISAAIAESGYEDQGDGTVVASGAIDRSVGGGSYSYDALGRLLHQADTNAAGTVIYDNRQTYDSKGRIATQQTTQLQKSVYYGTTGTYTTTVTNSYGDGTADYALGAITSSTTSGFAIENGVYRTMPVSSTVSSYAWYEGAVQSSVVYTPDTGQPGTSFTTSYYYSGSGVFTSAIVADGQPRTITVKSDVLGQVIRRDESKNSGNTKIGGDPHEVWYRFNGRQIGFNGNNSTYDSSYAGSLVDRERTPFSGTSTGSFRFGATAGASFGDFNTRLTPVNSFQQGSSGGSYTVRTGDTLSSIAAQVWGDASLWYKIAEANGLNAASTLVEGQTLTLPGGVSKNGNSSSTFKPYDPSDAYGDTSPTTPKPQAANKNKCGVFGQILLVAIAIAVSAVTYGALTSASTTILGGIAAGAVAGAAGSIASQVVGVATGIQDSFSWKGVALGAIAGAVGGGIGEFARGATEAAKAGEALSALGKVGNFLGRGGFVSGAARGVLSSVITQGIGVATKLQSKFDFVGVAVGGMVGGVSSAINLGGFEGRIVSGAAGALAGAATRSLLDGSSFGDNILAALPDVIGSTIGNLVARQVAGGRKQSAGEKVLLAEAQKSANAPIGAAGSQTAAISSPAATEVDAQPDDVVVTARRSRVSVSGTYSPTHNIGLLENIGYTNRRPQTREENAAQTQGVTKSINSRKDLTLGQKDKALTNLYNRSSYWDSILPSNAPDVAAGIAGSASFLGIAYVGGALTIGGSGGLVISAESLSLGGSDGIYLGNDAITIGGRGGIYLGNGGISIGGTEGIYAGTGRLSIGGASGIVVDQRTFSIGGYTLWNEGAAENVGASSVANGARLGPQLLAEEVANGHALAKHLAGGEFAPLGIRTKAQFQDFVEGIVSNPATPTRYASDGTKYFLDESTRTIVISGSRGEATAFRPDYGVGWENYLNSQVPRNARLPGYDPVPRGR